jgi:hypothetical protein
MSYAAEARPSSTVRGRVPGAKAAPPAKPQALLPGWWPGKSAATVREAFSRWARDWETSGPTRAFAVREAATGRLAGGCDLHLLADGSAQVSYWTSASQRRRGHATRALACSCNTLSPGSLRLIGISFVVGLALIPIGDLLSRIP